MNIELTEQQLQLADEQPVRITHPATQREYIVIRAEVYERLRGVLEDMPDAAGFMNEVMAEEDANDPLLESYQDYRQEVR